MFLPWIWVANVVGVGLSDAEASEGEIEIAGVGVLVEAMMASEMAALEFVMAVTVSILEKESSLETFFLEMHVEKRRHEQIRKPNNFSTPMHTIRSLPKLLYAVSTVFFRFGYGAETYL